MIIKKLITQLNKWANTKYSTAVLFAVAFAESSFFIVPPDIMLIYMAYINKHKALFYSAITTLASVLGGVLGFYLGLIFFNQFIEPLIIKFNYINSFNAFKNLYLTYGFLAIFIAGFTPIPYKIATIASGVFGVNIWLFVLASVLSRGLRFFLISIIILVLKKLSLPQIKKNINVVILICSVIIVLLALVIYFI